MTHFSLSQTTLGPDGLHHHPHLMHVGQGCQLTLIYSFGKDVRKMLSEDLDICEVGRNRQDFFKHLNTYWSVVVISHKAHWHIVYERSSDRSTLPHGVTKQRLGINTIVTCQLGVSAGVQASCEFGWLPDVVFISVLVTEES